MTCMGFQTRIRRNSKKGTELPHVGTVSLGYIFMFFFPTHMQFNPQSKCQVHMHSFSIDSKQNITGLQSKLMQAGDLPKNRVEDSVARIPPAPKKHSWQLTNQRPKKACSMLHCFSSCRFCNSTRPQDVFMSDALYEAAWSKVQSVERTVVVLPDRLIE